MSVPPKGAAEWPEVEDERVAAESARALFGLMTTFRGAIGGQFRGDWQGAGIADLEDLR